MRRYCVKLLILFTAILLAYPMCSFAQATTIEDMEITLFPKYPEPNKTVQASLKAFGFDTERSTITWKLNDKIISQGLGAKTVTFKNGAVGTRNTLTVSVITEEKEEVSRTIEISGADVDLIWESFTHTPVFYKGKAEPVLKSKIRVSAIPYGFGSTKNLIYNWERNYRGETLSSGVNRNTLTFDFSDILQEEKIRVTISDQENRVTVQKMITIRKVNPQIIFYEKKPLEGVLYNKSISEFDMANKTDAMIKAEPFFYPINTLNSLSFKWIKNGNLSFPTVKPNIIDRKSVV